MIVGERAVVTIAKIRQAKNLRKWKVKGLWVPELELTNKTIGKSGIRLIEGIQLCKCLSVS